MEYYSALKKERLTHATMRVNLKSVVPSESCHTQGWLTLCDPGHVRYLERSGS